MRGVKEAVNGREGAKRGTPPPFQATRSELIMTELVKTPNDLVRHVAVRWPEVWQAVLLRARAEGKVPGVVLLAAIEGGLGIEVTCG